MRKFTRLAISAGAAAAVIGGAFIAGPASAAPNGGACTLDGTANFHPGPGASPTGAFAYDFSGTLSNCQSGDASNPGGGGPVSAGTISAGQPFTLNGVTYNALDNPSGTGSCAEGTTNGTAVVIWDGGKNVSFVSFSTTSVAAGVALQGTVLKSVQATDANTGAVTTLASTVYGGDTAAGALAFEVTDPTQCTAANGVTSAGIDGVTAIGSPS